MSGNLLWLFLGSVFATVFLLSQVLILPTFGTDNKQRKKLQHRFDKLLANQENTQQQLLKEQYLKKLSPLARSIESISIMTKLKTYLEQAGIAMPAYRFVLLDVFLSTVVVIFVWIFYHNIIGILIAFLVGLYLPFFWLQKKRNKNLEKFEEQLPEALEMMARSLRTGYPFNECLKIVAEEMPDPIGHQFGLVFDEVNYGRNLQIALALMMERVPSLSLSAMSTSVIIQKETGGNMAEILLKISEVLRGRVKLFRKIKTLSAEGIFGAWVLCLVPIVMFVVLTLINPDHFKALLEHPNGINLFYAIAVFELIAIFWMRLIVRIDV